MKIGSTVEVIKINFYTIKLEAMLKGFSEYKDTIYASFPKKEFEIDSIIISFYLFRNIS